MDRSEREDQGDEQHVGDPEDPDLPRGARVLRVHVRAEVGEVLVGARVALAAGGDDVLPRDRTVGVAGRQDLVTAVALAADGGLGGAEHVRLAVVAVQVGLLGVRVAAPAQLSSAERGTPRSLGGTMLCASWQSPQSGALSESCLRVRSPWKDPEYIFISWLWQLPQAVILAVLSQPSVTNCRVLAGVEADVAARAGELAVSRVGLDVRVDVDALLLAVDVDGGRVGGAVDDDLAIDGLRAMAGEALLIAARAGRRAVRPAGPRVARAERWARSAEAGAATLAIRQNATTSTAAASSAGSRGGGASLLDLHGCSLAWQASHMLCG